MLYFFVSCVDASNTYIIFDCDNLQDQFNSFVTTNKIAPDFVTIQIAPQYQKDAHFILKAIESWDVLRKKDAENLLHCAKRWLKWRDIFCINEVLNQVLNQVLDKTITSLCTQGFALFSIQDRKDLMSVVGKNSLAINKEFKDFFCLCIPSLKTSSNQHRSQISGGNSFTYLKSVPSTFKLCGMQLKLFVCSMVNIVVIACGLILSPLILSYWLLYKKGRGAIQKVKEMKPMVEGLSILQMIESMQVQQPQVQAGRVQQNKLKKNNGDPDELD